MVAYLFVEHYSEVLQHQHYLFVVVLLVSVECEYPFLLHRVETEASSVVVIYLLASSVGAYHLALVAWLVLAAFHHPLEEEA